MRCSIQLNASAIASDFLLFCHIMHNWHAYIAYTQGFQSQIVFGLEKAGYKRNSKMFTSDVLEAQLFRCFFLLELKLLTNKLLNYKSLSYFGNKIFNILWPKTDISKFICLDVVLAVFSFSSWNLLSHIENKLLTSADHLYSHTKPTVFPYYIINLRVNP